MAYSVLVPVDTDGDRALNQARYVARFDDTQGAVEATVLYVYPRGRSPDDEATAFSRVPAAVRAAEYLEGEGVTTIRRVVEGPVSERIVNAADGMDADEIVVGGRKRSGVQKVLLGSTTQDVVLSTERPVTVTGTDVTIGDRIERLLVPVDRDEERARHQAAYVAGLPGITEGVDVTVLYVFPHQDYAGAPSHEFVEVDAAVAAADYLEKRGVAVDRAAVGGEVTRTIVEHANELDADGLVVGGRKRSGLQEVLMGSTSTDIVLSVERPVTITG
jgi:nucleotide-binding universal stress UspA family protein